MACPHKNLDKNVWQSTKNVSKMECLLKSNPETIQGIEIASTQREVGQSSI